MVSVDQTEPADIVDRLLWRDAQHLLGRHDRPDADFNCVWCGRRWPCAPRRLAERANTAARRPWREAWTLRHDLNSIRPTGLHAGLRDNLDRRRTAGPAGADRRARRAANRTAHEPPPRHRANRGAFG
ncbi:hypothetical protein EV385_3978 [Krasilnikovia cinnamomea]|uniref:Uncharacterized protein n=1 Tax=Krasilnikovia cinnamomea TaxID=349313 RepID=A0A4V2G7D3_9ACTN|nr:hypothetical protein [Krasilnikovia cinnamomea]RZU52136.1 hypothetical protein EV385_3978 [Krasilnikovia cinnamomea]